MKKHISIVARDGNGIYAVLHFTTLNEWIPMERDIPADKMRSFIPKIVIKTDIDTTEGDDDVTVALLSQPMEMSDGKG